MDPSAARQYAERTHAGVSDRYGMPLLDHVRRVVVRVPREARTVAWLHELLEYTTVGAAQLAALGVSEVEVRAVQLLTRDTDADADADHRGYHTHIERIASAPGAAGALARVVKRADLLDRLCHQHDGADSVARPPYRAALARLGPTATSDQGALRGATASRTSPRDSRRWLVAR